MLCDDSSVLDAGYLLSWQRQLLGGAVDAVLHVYGDVDSVLIGASVCNSLSSTLVPQHPVDREQFLCLCAPHRVGFTLSLFPLETTLRCHHLPVVAHPTVSPPPCAHLRDLSALLAGAQEDLSKRSVFAQWQ